MNTIAPYALAIKLGVVALLVGGVTLWHYSEVRDARKEGYDNAVSERIAADLALTIDRNAENAATQARQRDANITITKVKDEELAPVLARVDAAPGLRRPKAICDSPAAPAQAPSAAGGDSADPPGRLVREDIDRDIRALIKDVEQDLATGRACQSFLKANDLVP